MNKLHRIHMLPTDKSSNLFKQDDGFLVLLPKVYKTDGLAQPQHIYITSDEEIKVGDWYIFLANNRAVGLYQKKHKEEKSVYYHKIVATTNKELWGKLTVTNPTENVHDWDGKSRWSSDIRKIGKSFIEEYVKHPFEEVMLETQNCAHPEECGQVIEYTELKLNPAGEVIWEKKEESLRDKLFGAFIVGIANPQLKADELITFFDEWFNKNYKS